MTGFSDSRFAKSDGNQLKRLDVKLREHRNCSARAAIRYCLGRRCLCRSQISGSKEQESMVVSQTRSLALFWYSPQDRYRTSNPQM